MNRWEYRTKIKHLLNENEDWETVQATMNSIADILSKAPGWAGFDLALFRQIPKKSNGFFEPVDCANELLDRMYSYADFNRIWIE